MAVSILLFAWLSHAVMTLLLTDLYHHLIDLHQCLCRLPSESLRLFHPAILRSTDQVFRLDMATVALAMGLDICLVTTRTACTQGDCMVGWGWIGLWVAMVVSATKVLLRLCSRRSWVHARHSSQSKASSKQWCQLLQCWSQHFKLSTARSEQLLALRITCPDFGLISRESFLRWRFFALCGGLSSNCWFFSTFVSRPASMNFCGQSPAQK